MKCLHGILTTENTNLRSRSNVYLDIKMNFKIYRDQEFGPNSHRFENE